METKTIRLENLEEEDYFLLELAAAEAEAEAASAKRPRVAVPEAKPSPPAPPPMALEGAYTAALRGSKSGLWQQSPFNPTAKSPRVSAGGGFHSSNGEGGSVYSNLAGKYGSATGDQDIPEKHCPCGLGVCLVLTSNTQKNPGRKFYKCPIREENGGCGFFQWCDADQSSGTYTGTHNNASMNEPKFPELQCPCGAGLCRVLTAKTGQNIGQQFYRCPAFEGSCGFFKWCNDHAVTSSTPYNFTKTNNFGDSDTGGYQSPKAGTSCFKCGKDGHWARDCPVQSGKSQPETGRGKSSSSTGDCYKCGKPGHWARDCTSNTSQFASALGKRQRLQY